MTRKRIAIIGPALLVLIAVAYWLFWALCNDCALWP